MHRCWKVNELTSMIFECLGPVHNTLSTPTRRRNRNSPQSTLSRLARTCRDFTNPALDLLWEKQPTIFWLLKCLPAHTWVMLDGSFTIQTAMEPGEWDRVLAYATRIKSLDLDQTGREGDLQRHTLHKSVLESIGMTFPNECLLPNLQVLNVTLNSGVAPYLHLLLSPRLQEISFELCGPIWRLGVLHLVRMKCPFLRVVSLSRADFLPSDETYVVSSFVAQLPHLRSVAVESLTPQAYHSLAGLPHLEHIEVRAMETAPFPGMNPPSTATDFRALRSFNIDVSTVDCAINFMLRLASNTALREVQISISPDPTTTDSFALCSAVQSHCWSTSLTSIGIDFGTEYLNTATQENAHSDLYMITPQTLHPLLLCSRIQVVRLVSPLVFSLDDAFVAAMALAWPSIRRLSIDGRKSNPSDTIPTIMGLIPFSRHCPQLRSLQLDVDATNVRMDDPSRSPRVLQTALTYVDFLNSPITSGSASNVANFLCSVFPSLWMISVSETVKEWTQVSQLLPIYSAIRADERRLGAELI
ncbi:hypothetical protein C8R46DRAFT_1198276 [Mycena filopes]|nr:hypothetical protein C8R46DRAFT_1198276 [Mycena filopes]